MHLKKLKQQVSFEECLEYVKEAALSRLLLKFWLVTHRLFEEVGRHANRDGSQECPNKHWSLYEFQNLGPWQ